MKIHFFTDAMPTRASARFRAYALAKAWNSPDVTCGPLSDPAVLEAEAIIITRLIGQQVQFQSDARLVFWDLTDPTWCWMGDRAFVQTAEQMTGLTVSSEGLADALAQEFGIRATVIPDRLPYQAQRRIHTDVAVPKLIWFGYGFNRYPALSGVGPILKRLHENGVPFELQIVDDQPEMPMYESDRYGLFAQTTHHRWDLDTITDLLCAADVAMLPPFPGWVGTVKSTNRALTAAWSGLPIVDGSDYRTLERLLMDVEARRAAGAAARSWAEREGDITQSVAQWQTLLQPVTTGG